MRSSGCDGGGGGRVTRLEMVTSQLESATCSSSFQGNNCNVNGSRPDFWNKISAINLHSQTSQLSNCCNEEALIDHEIRHIEYPFDMNTISQAKRSQRKSGKASRSNFNCCRSRVAHTEASFNVTGSLDVNSSPNELQSYPEKCSNSEKMQTAKQKIVPVKRSEKRNVKISKSKWDSFSIKAGLSSFNLAAGGNNIFGLYGSKHDMYDGFKHLDDLSLNELLDNSYKHPQPIRDKQNNTENLNKNLLQSVRDACSVLQLKKSTQPQNLPLVDNTYHQNASSSKSDDSKRDMIDPSSKKVKVIEYPLLAPEDIMKRLALFPSKDLDLLLLDTMKLTTSMSKANLIRGGLPSFSWSHISGAHFKTNPDVVKLTHNKSQCQGRWVKIGSATTSFGDTTDFLADFGSLAYDQSLVPLKSQHTGSTEKETSPLPFIASNTRDGAIAAAQTLCEIAAHFNKQNQSAMMRWPKKPSQKSMRSTKLKSDEKLEKALFMSSKPLGPANLNAPMKRPFATPIPSRLSNKPAKLRKLVPIEWSSAANKNRY